MGNPAWRRIGGGPVPERKGVAWTPLVENVTPGKVIKIEVARIAAETTTEGAKAAADQAAAEAAAAKAELKARQKEAELASARKDLETAQTNHRKAVADLEKSDPGGKAAAGSALAARERELEEAIGKVRAAVQEAEEASGQAAAAAAAAGASLPNVDQFWTPKTAGRCTADGNRRAAGSDKFVISGAPAGCLIARIGGGSADMTAENGAPMRILFAVGRFSVLALPDSLKAGPVFLAANDVPDLVDQVEGQLRVDVYESM